jgi:type I restriction enzyme R subunit
MFCVSSVATLIKYYELFKLQQADAIRPLKIATIFSYVANEEDPEVNGLISGLIPEESPDLPTGACINQSSRDKLDEFIADYNALFGTKYSTKDSQTFYNYYQDIAKRVRSGQIDILLVVNMFLTRFDSPRLNTMYVDKNLKFHGLIQAFSRTNRNLNEKKSQGNIVCFRNLKAATDEAIALFSNKDAKETVLVEPYEDYVKAFNKAIEELQAIAPTVQSVDNLPSEKEQLAFVIRFRELLRVKNILTTFADFDEADLSLPAQTFEDYKSKYLDVYDKGERGQGKEKTSILEDMDFELSLIHRDEINVAYILNLLMALSKMAPEDRAKRQKEIVDIVAGEMQLRSKKLLIQTFIDENLPNIKPTDNVIAAFESFWSDNKQKAFSALCEEEQILPEQLEKLLNDYTFANRLPREQEIVSALSFKPKILQRKSIIERVGDKIKAFIDTFIEGMGGECLNVMKNDRDIVKALASEIAKKITRKTIFELQRMPYDSPLSGDFSGLTTVWDEICVQVQKEMSHYWDSYDLTVRSLIDYDVSELKPFEQLALWFQTEACWEWECEKQDEKELPPVFDSEIVDYLLAEYIYSEAMEWRNAKIKKYLDRSY